MDQHSGMNGSGVTMLSKTSTSPIPESTNFTYAQEGSAFVGFDVIRKMLCWYQFFKNYLDHFGLLLTTIVVILACSLRGDIVFLALLTYKTYTGSSLAAINLKQEGNTTSIAHDFSPNDVYTTTYMTILPDYLQLPDEYNLKDLLFYVAVGVGISQASFQLLCGFLQIYFYKMQRHSPEKWKCQPHRFLTVSNELHEIIIGTTNMTIGGALSGFLTCWITNGNRSMFYYQVEDYGYLYFLLSFVMVFFWIDGVSFYYHKLMHTSLLYKHLHKQHHRYTSPTAYSVVAFSPFEMLFLNCIVIAPMFLFPVHPVPYMTNVIYVYYYGVMDHSGVKMESIFPWQPNTLFHDNHHRCFHVNLGFNTYLFDWLHGTLKRDDRIYGEDIFGGKGKKTD